ncbi:MAG: nucleotide exchange factor GrpE [Saprospiraceae bacterium]|nr:nucleotide exchange factor GrpE [Saprospiraceae bacterium]
MAKAKKSTKKTSETQEDIAVQDASAEIEQLQIELGEAKDKYLRLFAEFENFKKRNTKERLELIKTAAQDTLNAILPVLDDFDRAKKSAEDENTEEVFPEGVELVYQKIYSVLKGRGLQAMETTGETFDPEVHEAITEIPAPTQEMKGKIIDTVEKGYYLNDKIIRFPKVVVGK